MKTSIRIRLAALGLVALVAAMAPASMQAQGARKASVGAVKGLKGAKASKGARVKAAKKHAAKGKRNLKRLEKKGTPAQQAWARSLIAERKSLKAGVVSGSITKSAAAAQRKAWRSANPRPKK